MMSKRFWVALIYFALSQVAGATERLETEVARAGSFLPGHFVIQDAKWEVVISRTAEANGETVWDDDFRISILDRENGSQRSLSWPNSYGGFEFAVLSQDRLLLGAYFYGGSFGYGKLIQIDLKSLKEKDLYKNGTDEGFYEISLSPDHKTVLGIPGSSSRNRWPSPDNLLMFEQDPKSGDWTTTELLDKEGRPACNTAKVEQLRVVSKIEWSYPKKALMVLREGKEPRFDGPNWTYRVAAVVPSQGPCGLKIAPLKLRHPKMSPGLIEGEPVLFRDNLVFTKIDEARGKVSVQYYFDEKSETTALPE